MEGQTNKNYIKNADLVFEYFTNLNCKVGEGGFYYRWLLSQEGQMKHQQINLLMMVARNLIENGFLEKKDNDFICLTQAGYDYIQGGTLVSNNIDLTHYVDLSGSLEAQYGQLWEIIGNEDTALFYVSGPEYYKAAQTFLPQFPPNYTIFMSLLEKHMRSRVMWYRHLYFSIDDNYKESFLKELSEKIKILYHDNEPDEDDEDELLSVLTSADTEIVTKQKTVMARQNPVKIFISHSSKDTEFVKAFVDLLISIGINKSAQLFCSSYPPFGVKLNDNIFDTLRQQYNEYRLYMIYMLSDNYYQSPVSLNEMGAGWVLQYEGQCITLPGFEVKNVKGCVDNNKIALVADATDFSLRLNDFKDNILRIMELPAIENNLWEQKRDEFINKVRQKKILIDFSSDSLLK